MRITIMTLFPQMIEQAVSHSIMGRAIEASQVEIRAVNIRDYSNNKHKQVDDYPYGGGAGMLMKPGPVKWCYEAICESSPNTKKRVMYMTPHGKPWKQAMADEFAKEEEIVILCGHYEGIDQRVIEDIVTDEVSIGDFVLTGGELAALVITDSIVRLLPNVLGKQESFQEESFCDGLLEYYHYTRPAVFEGKEVPEVLLSGHHKNIEKYRRQNSLENTYKKRPDLLEQVQLSVEDRKFLQSVGYNNI
ncbi:MAG: tRNA (guanosine(37)-N1)-methyltransferase TrmD [Epulopiscium sp. Nele67-Bin001]|nr:MAG: tRNA (guanosine(37)-N1)-methyltransferase TrmD [Epulopiscium sp. Nuni2H_MBin001]OON90852.1 MAG: tRNA (guanosine(37)-N1)-methyltransferase TrmD [Epulopiscium sp. Nele67-Bin001]